MNIEDKPLAGTMPSFQFDYTVPLDSPPIVACSALFRLNNYFGDGSVNGWMQQVSGESFIVTVDGQISPMSYYSGYTLWGVYDDFDQFTQYYQANIDNGSLPSIQVNPGSVISFQGQFQRVSYFNIELCFTYGDRSGKYVVFNGEDMTAVSPGLNPYIKGNPSVFAYPDPSTTVTKNYPAPDANSQLRTKKTQAISSEPNMNENGRVDIYRMDKETATLGTPDGMEADGCPDYYLTYPGETRYSALILRIKMPTTVIENGSPDTVYGDYQCDEYTITISQVYSEIQQSRPTLDYYGVCSRQLYDNIDENGYAYVFFLDDEYVNALTDAQQTPLATPPVVSWGDYKGVAMGLPSYDILFRLRGPSSSWQGAPVNAPCYLNPEGNQPLTAAELGEWLPELYGGTFEDFLNGNIGVVYKDQPWPESV